MFKFLEEFAKSVVAITVMVAVVLVLAAVVALIASQMPTWMFVVLLVVCVAMLVFYEAKS